MNVETTFLVFECATTSFGAPCCRAAPSSERGRRPDVRIILKAPT